jgi:FHS family L-fucose permease-like MFS transporter
MKKSPTFENPKPKKMKKSPYIVFIILLTFFVISFLSNIIGPIIPDIITGFHLSMTMVSLLPFAFFIAYGFMSIPAGIMLEVFKEKKVMMFAFLLSSLGSLLIVISPNYISAIVSLFMIGCGMAMLQVVANPLLRTAGGEENYANFSVWAQLIFGSASYLSPFVYQSFILQKKLSFSQSGLVSSFFQEIPDAFPWLSLYVLFIAVSLLMVVIIYASKFPKVDLDESEKPGRLEIYLTLFKNKYVILYFIAMLCYVGTEQGISNWISQFLSTYHGVDPQTTGADTIAYFWGLMTAGGILGLILLKILDSRIVLVTFSFLAIASLALALLGTKSMALLAFPLLGLFLSVMFPIIFSLALNSFKENHGSFSGILVTGIVGGAILPFIVGGLGDIFGLKIGMSVLFVTLLYIFSIGFWAKPLVNNKHLNLFKEKE